MDELPDYTDYTIVQYAVKNDPGMVEAVDPSLLAEIRDGLARLASEIVDAQIMAFYTKGGGVYADHPGSGGQLCHPGRGEGLRGEGGEDAFGPQRAAERARFSLELFPVS